MMSLFSSFDLYFFPLTFFMFFLFISNIFSKVYMLNSMNTFMKNTYMTLDNFFQSLKTKMFNKSVIVYLIALVSALFLMNFSSVLSFSFPLTSQVSLIFLLGVTTWVSFMMFFNYSSVKGFLSHCVPEGTPLYLVWFLFFIEIISNLIRPLTITVRLVANILAGHLLMILLSNLVLNYMFCSPLYMVLNLVEFFVAIIQAYIFTTMIALYYSDSS